MSCCFPSECNRDEGTREGGGCTKVSEEARFSPDPSQIKPFVCIPCKDIILSWIVEVVEWIDGACVSFDIEDSPTFPPFCIESEPLESGFGGS